MARILKGRPVVPGSGRGEALVLSEPLCFWGGYDVATGRIINPRHEQAGQIAAGRILLFPRGKGSSTGSAILLESIKAGTAPAGIINMRTDAIAAVGAIVADEMYHRSLPIVVLAEEAYRSIRQGEELLIEPDGTVTVNPD